MLNQAYRAEKQDNLSTNVANWETTGSPVIGHTIGYTKRLTHRDRQAAHVMAPELKPHGTLAAHRRHQRRGEKPCAECTAAASGYHREYLARADEKVITKKRAYDRAYTRANSRLIAAHADEMAALVAEELEAEQ